MKCFLFSFAGSPEVTLTGIKAEVNVRIVAVGNGRFKCSYIAVVPGAYLLHINWNGRQLRGSPYKVNVIGAFYPNKVIVSGEGIQGGILGREIDVRIDTRKAGPGIDNMNKPWHIKTNKIKCVLSEFADQHMYLQNMISLSCVLCG